VHAERKHVADEFRGMVVGVLDLYDYSSIIRVNHHTIIVHLDDELVELSRLVVQRGKCGDNSYRKTRVLINSK